ncbi:zinc-finger domain-containing protein [Achromobacter sp.]|uniref:zinc-finger domain-containing protein n=1 Tax=Achromobacter sp. TaxID=134375 RepID=UPI0028A821CF|nr:zinc-finger domain-containing protein [Achromobacter sp.]
MTAAAPAAVPRAHEVIEVGAEDLPVFCPGPKAPLWSMHPRVFLDVARTGSASCAYCGAEYRLKAGTVLHGHGH